MYMTVFGRVTEDGRLQLSDYGITASLFPPSYYTAEDSPAKDLVKWMAPETIENFEFTSKSDVVSGLFLCGLIYCLSKTVT